MNTSSPARREDPRPAQTRELVLHAARMIIASHGPAAVSPTRLVEMSGVARSTIYRHWPDADAVVADALDIGVADRALHASGDPGTDLRSYLEELRAMLESPAAGIVIAQAEVAERDATAAETMRGNAKYRNGVIHEMLADPRDEFDSVHAQLVGPLFMQRFFMRKPITDELIEEIVEGYLAARADQD